MNCNECGAVLPAEARFCLQCGARVQAAPAEAADPLRDTLERAIGFQYRIERLLGRGGMGAVYLAHELALDRDVAIKVLPPEHAGTSQMRARFKQEARTAARLTHPNIVPLHTFGEVDGLMYFVMGYVPGESLAIRLQRHGALSSESTRTLLADLAGALEYAHRQGVVHRDLKPDNILIDSDSGAPLLTDFGISKAPLGGGLTMTGQVIGTVDYMSPEQARGLPDVDARSDLYSLGLVGYEMIAGRRPLSAGSALDALTQRLTKDPPPLRAAAPGADEDLAAAIMRCLQREPSDRWPDARTLRAAIAPTDEMEDPLPIRLLRLATAFTLAVAIASVYLNVFKGPAAAFGILLGMLTPLTAMLVGTFVVLKRQRLTAKSILRLACLQPRGWRFWYPKAFRRRGDVWDRLPTPMRRSRMQFAAGFCAVVFVAVPIQLGLFLTRRPSAVSNAAGIFVLSYLLFMFTKRRRVTTYVAKAVNITREEASRIVSLASWRTTAWHTGPAAALLRATDAANTTASALAETTPTVFVASRPDRSNDVTRL